MMLGMEGIMGKRSHAERTKGGRPESVADKAIVTDLSNYEVFMKL
jgi:hypothetical protein